MNLQLVKIEKPEEINFIFGMSHFIKTVEDIHEAIVQTCPQIKFGIAFCEASGPRLIRLSGNCKEMISLAEKNALNISAGHTFFVFIKEGFPVSILNVIKNVPEVCRIFCATANPVFVALAEESEQRGVLGVLDGFKPLGIETEKDAQDRITFLRQIGYKLG